MAKIKNKTRADGRICSQIYLGKDDNGKKMYKTVYAKSQRELEDKVNELKVRLGKGIDIFAERDTFDDWGQRWLRRKKMRVSESWYSVLNINYKKLESIYSVEVSRLRPIDLEDILDDLCRQGYSARVLKAVRDIAAGVMQMCLENRVVEFNPFSASELPQAKPIRLNNRRALTAEEQRWVRETPHRAQTAAMIMMYAGLRRGELLALRWSDIDLNAKTITICRSVEMIDGLPRTKEGGKTCAASRVVFIPQRLADYLKAQPRESLLVVTAADGKPMTSSAWRRMWESYIKDLNLKYGDFGSVIINGKPMPRPKSKNQRGGVPIIIPRFTPHWLRHTFITLMYLSGVDVLTAAQQAGHADIKVTMDIYTHLDNEFKTKNIDKLDSYLEKSS